MALAYYQREGLWGGQGGSPWTEGIYSDIKTILIKHGDMIDSIRLDYIIRGKSTSRTVQGYQHGGTGGVETTINVAASGSPITKVHGCADDKFLRQLTFINEKGYQYGPYGKPIGNTFETKTSGKIVGFCGRSGQYVDALGVYFLES